MKFQFFKNWSKKIGGNRHPPKKSWCSFDSRLLVLERGLLSIYIYLANRKGHQLEINSHALKKFFCRRREETVHHFLFDCPAHEHARFKLGCKLGRLSKSLWYILGSQKAFKLLIHYVNETGRFRDNPEPPQHAHTAAC